MALHMLAPVADPATMTSYEVHGWNRVRQHTVVAQAMLSVPDIGSWLAATYATIARQLAARESEPAGPPSARYHRLDGRFAVEAGYPVSAPVRPEGAVKPSSLPSGPAAETVYIGPSESDDMKPAYDALASWAQLQGAEPDGDPWEVYLSDPKASPIRRSGRPWSCSPTGFCPGAGEPAR